MIKTHQEGWDLHNICRSQYELEIEMVCLNSAFEELLHLKKSLERAKSLAQEYPKQVVLKESEFHEDSAPYYEISLYCNAKDKSKFIQVIESFGLEVDLINETKYYY